MKSGSGKRWFALTMPESWEQVVFATLVLNSLMVGAKIFQYIYCHGIWDKAMEKTLMGLISIISFVTLLVVVTAYTEAISNQAKGVLVFIALWLQKEDAMPTLR